MPTFSPQRIKGSHLITSSDISKSQVLGNIRSARARFSDSERAEINRRYDEICASENPRPVVDGALIDRFIDKHTAVHGSYKVVSKNSQIPAAVDDFLSAHDLPTEMVMSDTDFLHTIDWPDDWKIERRTARESDLISVTDAICAIAETGTILIASSPKVSSTHLYLPENHVVIMDIGQLVRHLDDALQLASQQMTGHSRGLHMITGPSKTADVEQTIQYGAHGPRRLHAVFVDSSTSAR